MPRQDHHCLQFFLFQGLPGLTGRRCICLACLSLGFLGVPGGVADHHLSLPKMVCNEVNVDIIGSSDPVLAGLPVTCQILHHYAWHPSQAPQLAVMDML